MIGRAVKAALLLAICIPASILMAICYVFDPNILDYEP